MAVKKNVCAITIHANTWLLDYFTYFDIACLLHDIDMLSKKIMGLCASMQLDYVYAAYLK